MKKLYMLLSLMFVALGCVCLVSWVSQCHIDHHTPKWVLMDPPIMSLYLSVPGFFTSAIAAVVSFGHAS
jgi:hypothetical protein